VGIYFIILIFLCIVRFVTIAYISRVHYFEVLQNNTTLTSLYLIFMKLGSSYLHVRKCYLYSV